MTNKVLSFFKDAGKELVTHSHSLVRGIGNAVGMAGGFYAMYQLNGITDGATQLCVMGAAMGVGTYLLHRSKEEKNKSSFLSKASEYVLTATTIAAGGLGIAAMEMTHKGSDILQLFNLNQSDAAVAIAGGVAVPVLALLSGSVRMMRRMDSDQLVPAQTQNALKL
jgi:hypothetical protein